MPHDSPNPFKIKGFTLPSASAGDKTQLRQKDQFSEKSIRIFVCSSSNQAVPPGSAPRQLTLGAHACIRPTLTLMLIRVVAGGLLPRLLPCAAAHRVESPLISQNEGPLPGGFCAVRPVPAGHSSSWESSPCEGRPGGLFDNHPRAEYHTRFPINLRWPGK